MARWQVISEVLQRYGIAAASPWTSLGNAGGFSGASLWRGEYGGEALLLRCWPKEHPSPRRLAFIHSVLLHVRQRGCTVVAAPRTTESGGTFVEHVGRLWQVEPWMPGAADFHAEPSVAKAKAAVEMLAQFHGALTTWPHTPLSKPPTVDDRLSRLNECRELCQWRVPAEVEDSLTVVRDGMAEYAQLAPRLLPAVQQRTEALAAQSVTLQPVIRDIWTDHVFFEGNRVCGLVDFGAMRLDWPLTDLARLAGSLAQTDPSYFDVGLKAYCESRSLEIEPTAASVRTLDESSVLITPMTWISWLLFQGRRFEDMARVGVRFSAAMERLRILAASDS